jgi:hypothetical protein
MACGSSNTEGGGGAGSGGSTKSGGGGAGSGGATATGGSSGGSSGYASGWDEARIGDTGTNWWINARKGAYFFSVQINPSYTDAATGRAMVVSFAQTVVGKLKSGSPAPATLVPAAGEISGWTFDPDETKTMDGPAVATNMDDAVALIDGAADPFFVPGSYSAVGLAWERYVKDPYLLDLKVWQMASAADATKVYSDLLNNSLYSNVTWTTCSATDCP